MHFLWVYQCNRLMCDVERTYEKLVNHKPEASDSASDLQAFLMFSQHSSWIYYSGKPIEIALVKQ